MDARDMVLVAGSGCVFSPAFQGSLWRPMLITCKSGACERILNEKHNEFHGRIHQHPSNAYSTNSFVCTHHAQKDLEQGFNNFDRHVDGDAIPLLEHHHRRVSIDVGRWRRNCSVQVTHTKRKAFPPCPIFLSISEMPAHYGEGELW